MSMVRLDAPQAAARAAPDLVPGEKRAEPQTGSLFAALLAAVTLAPGMKGDVPAVQPLPTAAVEEGQAAGPVLQSGGAAAAPVQQAAAEPADEGSATQTQAAFSPPRPVQSGEAGGAFATTAAEASAGAVPAVGREPPPGAPPARAPLQPNAVVESALPEAESWRSLLRHRLESGEPAPGAAPEPHSLAQALDGPAAGAADLAPGEPAAEELLQASGEEPRSESLERDSSPVPSAPQADLVPAGGIPAPRADGVPSAAVVREAAAESVPLPQNHQIQETVPVEQVMDLVVEHLSESPEGEQTVTLKLHPEHLGEVRLQLHLAGREVRTLFEVSTPEARQALEQRGDELRQGLSQAGFTLSGFSVSTGDGRRQSWERWELEELLWQGRTERQVPQASPAPRRLRGAARVQHSGLLDRMA